ncbi:hypothetical protein DSO57_1030053 [Entomophthora muscae]|uniref:Uncharacterized protein n=1 Tax=Entomophthora muscae TaxID=34485 RepID=A0ACC2UM23_9FUNG|nr:hypothetical protein DSO57_1030053 [Entomophthora muscae]
MSDNTPINDVNPAVSPKSKSSSLNPTAQAFTPKETKVGASKDNRAHETPSSSSPNKPTPHKEKKNNKTEASSLTPKSGSKKTKVLRKPLKQEAKTSNSQVNEAPAQFASHRYLLKALHQIGNNFKIVHQEVSENQVSGSTAKIELSLPILDPDFPFDLNALSLAFQLFPSDGYTYFHFIKVLNQDIPRKIAVNIEAALAKHSSSKNGVTLLDSLKWLIQNLSSILSQPESTIIKFVSYKADAPNPKPTAEKQPCLPPKPMPSIKNDVTKSVSSANSYKSIDLQKLTLDPQAPLSRKEKDIAQMKRRFRSSFVVLSENHEFFKFQIKLAPSDPDYIFKVECSYFLIDITVPNDYPATGHSIYATIAPGRQTAKIHEYMLRNVEAKFNDYAKASQLTSILHCVNWLDTRIESLILQAQPKPTEVTQISSFVKIDKNTLNYSPPRGIQVEFPSAKPNANHVEIEVSSSQADLSGDKELDESSDELDPETIQLDSTPHCGIQLKATEMALKCISLANLTSVELEVNCDRCKRRLAAPKISMHQISLFACPGCHIQIGLQLRPVLFYPNAESLGYLDVLGCIPHTISRVSITANCESCDKQNCDLPEFKEILLDSQRRENCRQCHSLMEFNLSGVKLVKLAPSSALLENASSNSHVEDSVQILGGAIKKEKIAYKVGQPLPSFGACRHYKRSNRWLRFPCCGKAYPCDTCHDDASQGDHDMIFASAMICGFCSQETRYQYHREDPLCSRCGHKLTGSSKGKAFWEGGKGTRDPSKMSRNDPKKYAGRNKTISRAKKAAS